MNSIVSDETLHAFVDGELDVTESETLHRGESLCNALLWLA
jgi:anti-sigma factor RsiW